MMLFLIVPALVTGIQIGEYAPTLMFNEPESCSESLFHNLLFSFECRSLIDCCQSCSNTEDCRRIMFDKRNKMCSLFESGENCFHHENITDKVCYRQKKLCRPNLNICNRCPIGNYGDLCQNIIKDCRDGKEKGVVSNSSLISYIQPNIHGPILLVKCYFSRSMTVIQHRDKRCNELDFNRNWHEYKYGFGEVHGEYWLGLSNFKDINDNYPSLVLRLFFQDWRLFFYSFNLSNDSDGYRFNFDRYKNFVRNPTNMSLMSGVKSMRGQPFSTFDREFYNHSCPDRFKGGWWYLDDSDCAKANLNGKHNDVNLEAETHFFDDAGVRYIPSEVQIRIK